MSFTLFFFPLSLVNAVEIYTQKWTKTGSYTPKDKQTKWRSKHYESQKMFANMFPMLIMRRELACDLEIQSDCMQEICARL